MPLHVGGAAATSVYVGGTAASAVYVGSVKVWPVGAPLPGPNPADLWRGSQQVDNFLAANPELQPIADQPQAKWINTLSDAQNIPNLVSAAGTKTLLLCIYAIPGRDNGQYSAGGFPDRQSYLDFLTAVKNGLGDHPAFISYEPDALGLTPGMTATARAERIETLRLGVGILSTIPNAETYIDASQWISTTDQANMLQSVDVHLIRGITVNTSGYDAQSSCYSYAGGVVAELDARGVTGKRFLVDSSRNGVGPLTDADRPLADPWLNTSQAWCNPPKRRLGIVPGPGPADQPRCRANFWIKAPGESDGNFPSLAQSSYYGENAPSAGTFWVRQARDLLGLNPDPNPTPPPTTTTGTISDITADFDTDWGSFTVRSTGVSLVGGRGRIPTTPSYENIASTATYKLTGGSVSARIYRPTHTGATEASVNFAVNSDVAGERAQVWIDTVSNTIRFANESGYWDPSNVTLTYDPTAHAWVRIRESAGTLYFDTSPDGVTWTPRKSGASPAWASKTTSSVQVLSYLNGGTGTYAEVDGVNSAAT